MEDIIAKLPKVKGEDMLSNIDEKIKSGFYLDKICIDSDMIVSHKDERYIRLTFMNCVKMDDGTMYEDGGDYVYIYLPLPLRFDEEWFKIYQLINLTKETITCCDAEGYLKKK